MATATDALRTEIAWQGERTYLQTLREITDAHKGLASADKLVEDANRGMADSEGRKQAALRQTQAVLQAQAGVWSQQAQRVNSYALALGAASATLFAFGGNAVRVAAQVEQSRIGLATVTGSKAAGDATFEQLREFARQTPFEFAEMPGLAQKLLAMGTPLPDLIRDLRTLGDAASALGTGSAGMDRMAMALGQMRNSAKLMAQDMNQLVQAYIPAWDMLAQKLGVSVGEARKMSEAGQISGPFAAGAIMEGMQGRYGGAMAAQMESATGKASQLSDAMFQLNEQMGNALLPTIKTATDLVTAFAGALAAMPASQAGAIATTGGLGAVELGVGAAAFGISGRVLAGRAAAAQLAAANATLEAAGLAPLAAGGGGAAAVAGAVLPWLTTPLMAQGTAQDVGTRTQDWGKAALGSVLNMGPTAMSLQGALGLGNAIGGLFGMQGTLQQRIESWQVGGADVGRWMLNAMLPGNMVMGPAGPVPQVVERRGPSAETPAGTPPTPTPPPGATPPTVGELSEASLGRLRSWAAYLEQVAPRSSEAADASRQLADAYGQESARLFELAKEQRTAGDELTALQSEQSGWAALTAQNTLEVQANARAERDRAAALRETVAALNEAAGGAAGYIALLQRMGASQTMVRDAAKYQFELGRRRELVGIGQGDYGAVLAGVGAQLDAEQAFAGKEAAAFGRASWQRRPESVVSPWMMMAARGREAPAVQVHNHTVMVQTPRGWLQAEAQALAGENYWNGG